MSRKRILAITCQSQRLWFEGLKNSAFLKIVRNCAKQCLSGGCCEFQNPNQETCKPWRTKFQKTKTIEGFLHQPQNHFPLKLIPTEVFESKLTRLPCFWLLRVPFYCQEFYFFLQIRKVFLGTSWLWLVLESRLGLFQTLTCSESNFWLLCVFWVRSFGFSIFLLDNTKRLFYDGIVWRSE